MKTLFMLLTVVLALDLQVRPAHATLLSDLINGGEIVQGDKRFTNFEVSNIESSDPLAGNFTPTDPGNIDIQGFTNGIGEHGIRLVGPFEAHTTEATSLADLSFFLEYDVSINNAQFLIHDSRHAFSFTSIGIGSVNLTNQAGFHPNLNADNIQSTEGFGDNGVVDVEQTFFNNVNSQHMFHLIGIRAETTHDVENDVDVLAAINVPNIDLTFSQVPIPEPSTWLLLGAGIAGLALWRRHQKSNDRY